MSRSADLKAVARSRSFLMDAKEDLVIWYFGPTKISNLSTPTATKPFIDTYSTYRLMYSADDNSEVPPALTDANQGVTQLVNSGINFSETYIENGGGIEGYSGFTINIGYKSVNGTMYGLADAEGLWPPNAIVLGTIPNLGVFVGSASADNKLLPYKFIRFNTYTNGWRRVHLSVNKIGATDPIPADLADPQTIAEL